MTEIASSLFLIVGLISGLLGGLLGIGGGVVSVPFLYYFFLYTGSYQSKIMQIAVCTSLAAAFITSGISTYLQMRKKAIQFSIIKWMGPALVIGCVIGSMVAHYITSRWLSVIFGIMAVFLGIYFFFPKLPQLKIARTPNSSLSIFGLIIGALSSLLGIGGGSVAFPILLGYQVPVKNASATSSASTLISTGIGTLAYLVLSWNAPELPSTFGYIDVPAWIAISIGSSITSPIGVKLSHTLHVSLVKQIFGACLVLVGISMLIL